MSSRRRALSELPQASAAATPSRYAPSTPHAIRALQERSSAKRSARSARTVRRPNNNDNKNNNNNSNNHTETSFESIRPGGSIRNILRQFAKVTAPATKRRISTPVNGKGKGKGSTGQGKENARPDAHSDDGEQDDSITLQRPGFSFEVRKSVEEDEEDDSEIPVAPTPSALLEYGESSDDDGLEQPTITFQNVSRNQRDERAMSERLDRRRSRLSFYGVEGDNNDDEDGHDEDNEATIMTERGRRALSEEATGRLSRYSFGSIRMSEFGSELEIRRESDRQGKLAELEHENEYMPFDHDDDTSRYPEDNTLNHLPSSPTLNLADDSVHFLELDNDTFKLPMPEDEIEETSAQADQQDNRQLTKPGRMSLEAAQISEAEARSEDSEKPTSIDVEDLSRRQTALETAVTETQRVRRQRGKLTRHGTMVPSLPTSLVRRVATEVQTKQGKRKPKFGRDHIKALEQATEWFFEQVSEDLAAFASHRGRKRRIDVDDVLLLMKRQKTFQGHGDLARTAKDWLPKEVLEEFDLPDRP